MTASAVDLGGVAVVDGHCHPLFANPWTISAETLLSIFSEGRPGAMTAHIPQTGYYRRALRALARRFGATPTVDAVLARRQALGPATAAPAGTGTGVGGSQHNALFSAVTPRPVVPRPPPGGNSAVVVGVSVLVLILIGGMAAYCLARYRFRGNRVIFYAIFSTIMLPPQITVTPAGPSGRTSGRKRSRAARGPAP